MISNHKKRRKLSCSLALALAVFLPFTSSASQQTDPFYLRLLDKAQKSFFAKNYWDAAHDFEIAAFGLGQDSILRAKAYFFLSLSHYYLKNINKSEDFMRQGAELLGDRSLAVLGIPDSVLPDLETLLTFFNIQLAQSAPPIDQPSPSEKETQEKSTETPPEISQENRKPDEKEAANIDQDDPGNTPPLTLGKIKEGDIIDLDMVDTLPVVTQRVPAIYPSSASGSKITGTVIVNALISDTGSVIKTQIIRGIKGIGLNQAAEQAIRRWKFEPAMIKGIKVKVWMPINIVFKKQE